MKSLPMIIIFYRCVVFVSVVCGVIEPEPKTKPFRIKLCSLVCLLPNSNFSGLCKLFCLLNLELWICYNPQKIGSIKSVSRGCVFTYFPQFPSITFFFKYFYSNILLLVVEFQTCIYRLCDLIVMTKYLLKI